jgi:uncharacterized protein (UPF0333 family)
MISMTCKSTLFSISITAVLTILITVVGTLIYQQSLKAQTVTVNNTAENNGTMNDSGAKVPIRLPFAAENTMTNCNNRK